MTSPPSTQEIPTVLSPSKPAWNALSNGAIEVGSFMDNNSWPALSESVRVSPKSTSSDSLKPPLPVMETSNNPPGKEPSLENSPGSLMKQSNDHERDHFSKAGGFSPRSHAGNDRRRNYGGSRRGNSVHHGNYGNEWSNRSIGRGFHMQQLHQQRAVRPFSNHMGFSDFQSGIYYVSAPPHPESIGGVPFASHPTPNAQVMFFPAVDPQRAVLLKQIDYYFSPENLCKDLFLRQNMDEQGWVHISLIASFNRVKQLTNNIQYIVDTVHLSNVLEVQGDRIRKRNDWMAWVLHPADNSISASGLATQVANFDGLEAQFYNLYLDLDASKNTGLSGLAKNEATLARSASVKLSSQMPVRSSQDGGVQVSTYSDPIWNMRTLLRSDTM